MLYHSTPAPVWLWLKPPLLRLASVWVLSKVLAALSLCSKLKLDRPQLCPP